MRIAIVAPGLHRVLRGAEVAFEAIGRELARLPEVAVTLLGSGKARPEEPYQFIHVENIPRERFERWPRLPILRHEYAYEELTFLFNLTRRYRPNDFDVTLTCSYPFVNWWLRRGHQRPAHVFVTQNSDHPAQSDHSEYAWFGCEGLICTNQEYFERNQAHWHSCLITNGVDPGRFSPQSIDRATFGLPGQVPIALMVSALTPSKRVLSGIQAAAQIPDLHLVICGDGPERDQVMALGQRLMPQRFHLMQLSYEQMPNIYRVADVFLHMSLDEPFGNVYLEALATELPIVAHDRAVTRWILEDTSILVDTTDMAETAHGIRQALQEQSPETVALRGALIQQRFTWKAVGKQYFDFLQTVMASRQATPADVGLNKIKL